jgi:anti-sigma28 factor (negative regulator of flagellin synthesis)
MSQINTTNPPEYVPDARLSGTKLRPADGTSDHASTQEVNAPEDDLQLTRLGGVLNSLKKGATAMRSQVSQLMGAVRNGTYEVDPLSVSRSIVGDCLSSH